jgi:hypothetical protein
MRFPDIPIMERTFKLFEYLGLCDATREDGVLIPYVMGNPDGTDIYFYNERRLTYSQYQAEAAPDFGTSVDPKKASRRLERALSEYKEDLKDDLKTGWELLMRQDKHSMRTYLSMVRGEPDEVRLLRLFACVGLT